MKVKIIHTSILRAITGIRTQISTLEGLRVSVTLLKQKAS